MGTTHFRTDSPRPVSSVLSEDKETFEGLPAEPTGCRLSPILAGPSNHTPAFKRDRGEPGAGRGSAKVFPFASTAISRRRDHLCSCLLPPSGL